jgi:hypothetical protein
MIRALIVLMALGQVVAGGGHRKVFTSGGGGRPAFTNIFVADTSPLCGSSGTTCANGNGLHTLTDVVAGSNATQTSTGNQPIWNAASSGSAINGKATFTPALGLWMNQSTIGTISAPVSFYAVFRLGPLTDNQGIYGGSATGSVEWRISNSGQQQFLSSGTVLLGTGTTTYSSGTVYGLAVTYNPSTGAGAFYKCSGGTATSDGTFTNASSFTTATNNIGASEAVTDYFLGDIAETGNLIGTASITGVCSWLNTQYGI